MLDPNVINPEIEPLQPSGWWTREECANYLGVRPGTLAVRACNGTGGPPFTKILGRVRYDPAEVKKWLEQQTTTETVTPAARARKRARTLELAAT